MTPSQRLLLGGLIKSARDNLSDLVVSFVKNNESDSLAILVRIRNEISVVIDEFRQLDIPCLGYRMNGGK